MGDVLLQMLLILGCLIGIAVVYFHQKHLNQKHFEKMLRILEEKHRTRL